MSASSRPAAAALGYPLPDHSAAAGTPLSLTIHADGHSERELVGASCFPRHWIYDDGGKLITQTGLTDFTTWINDAFGERTPWFSQWKVRSSASSGQSSSAARRKRAVRSSRAIP